MAAGNIRECRAVWPPAGGSGSVARSATVAGTGLGVASLTIGWCTGSDGISPSIGSAVRMATARNAAGEWRRPGSRPVDRAGIGEAVRCCSARDVNLPIHVLRGVVETIVGRIDVGVAVFADGVRREAGVGGIGRREAVTRAATRGR